MGRELYLPTCIAHVAPRPPTAASHMQVATALTGWVVPRHHCTLLWVSTGWEQEMKPEEGRGRLETPVVVGHQLDSPVLDEFHIRQPTK